MPAPQKVLDLIATFERNAEHYTAAPYKEAMLRQQFINPLFEALGWDMENRQGNAPDYLDVIHEDAIKIGGAMKAPDYSFGIGKDRKFFVEAKKPSVKLKDDAEPAYQLRRYAWTKKLPLSILTNFREIAVYDGRIKPSQTDKASVARIRYLTLADLPAQWDDIAATFSKDAVLKGSFDKFADTAKGKRGTAAVDDAFLAEIEQWRLDLAKNLAARNRKLSQRDLNYAVQVTIDRIIFLRMCEDRGIEDYGRLRELADSSDIYQGLLDLFRQADSRYNSGLFYFKKDADHPADEPDTLTPILKIDDKPLKEIIGSLYYPDSPYEFSVFPTEILGQVYEQFLGKVIRLTAGHQAKVEDKPEVKKAGGVYYTPKYIVDYIVKHTVGKLLGEPGALATGVSAVAETKETPLSDSGKTPVTDVPGSPKQAAKLRILDPACGSGSFLLGAYQYLLDWHRGWYEANNPEKHAKAIYRASGGWRLTTGEKKRILVNNIFGVDIDPQAVEVTKLSLLLKVLEGESKDSLERNLFAHHERALPDLSSNIKCGNSLIGPDFYEGQQLTMFDDEERYRINVFDWNAAFPKIMKAGGFDAVIGNPPYSYRNATEETLRPYYLARYECAEGNFELYKFFVERALKLLKSAGRLGQIVSASFLIQPSFEKLRKLRVTKSGIERLAPLGPGVFENATVDTAVIIASKTAPTEKHRTTIVVPVSPLALPSTAGYLRLQRDFAQNEGFVFDYRLSDAGARLVNRLLRDFPRIETGYEFGVGINTGFIRDELVAPRRNNKRYHPMVPGSGISRFGGVITDGWIMYDKEFVRSRGHRGRTLPDERLLSSEKILVVRTRNLSLERRIIATIDRSKAYNLNRLSNIIARPGNRLTGLLGILNSGLFNWLYSTRYYDYEIKPVYLRNGPLADANDRRLSNLVDRMLALHQQLAKAKSPNDQATVQAQIAATDRQIDQLVYELYGLTDAEIRIVEEGTSE